MLPFPLNLWPVRGILPQNPDVIVALDYGVTVSKRNSDATNGSIKTATEFLKNFPEAHIVFGTSSHSFQGSAAFSTKEKKRLLEQLRVPEEKFFYAGGITNTVEEACAIRRVLQEQKIQPKEILVVCDRLHSRSVRFVFESVFPEVRISLFFMYEAAVQHDSIFPVLRSRWKWFLANVERQAALRIMGLDWVAKFKQRAE
jgi:uncharacterized SAM-binding protein YcdF (DUF218 family)